MDQCSRHDTPSVLWQPLTNEPGHVLSPEINVSVKEVVTGRRLGTTFTVKRQQVVDSH